MKRAEATTLPRHRMCPIEEHPFRSTDGPPVWSAIDLARAWVGYAVQHSEIEVGRDALCRPLFASEARAKWHTERRERQRNEHNQRLHEGGVPALGMPTIPDHF